MEREKRERNKPWQWTRPQTKPADKVTTPSEAAAWSQERPPVPPVPITPLPTVIFTPTTTEVKSATPEIILTSEEGTPIEVMADLIFEDIGGQELINISRSDIINGISVGYQPIKNLEYIQQQFNPNNIVPLQLTSDRYFANFPIKLDERVNPGGNVYRESNGDIVVEVIDINSDEQVEVEILTSGIIYEVDIL